MQEYKKGVKAMKEENPTLTFKGMQEAMDRNFDKKIRQQKLYLSYLQKVLSVQREIYDRMRSRESASVDDLDNQLLKVLEAEHDVAALAIQLE